MHTPDGSYIDPECAFQLADGQLCKADITCMECFCCDAHCFCAVSKNCTFPIISVEGMHPDRIIEIFTFARSRI